MAGESQNYFLKESDNVLPDYRINNIIVEEKSIRLFCSLDRDDDINYDSWFGSSEFLKYVNFYFILTGKLTPTSLAKIYYPKTRVQSLSGGQRQRIAIARTILTNPNLLVLDEATSALDYNTENNLCNNLINNLSDKTVFFITHRLATIKNSDLIIVMHNGKLDELGSYKQLMANKGRYYALESQQGNIG